MPTEAEVAKIERDANFRAEVLGSLSRILERQEDHESRLRSLERRVYAVVTGIVVIWAFVQFAAKYGPSVFGAGG